MHELKSFSPAYMVNFLIKHIIFFLTKQNHNALVYNLKPKYTLKNKINNTNRVKTYFLKM